MTDPPRNLRDELEETYDRVRSALMRGNLEDLRALVDPSPEDWEEILGDLADSLPPRSDTRFLEARQAGDWAAYGFETDLEDPRWVTLVVVRFRRRGSTWKLSGGASASQFERPADPADLRERLRSDPFLALPGEPGYEEV